MLSVCFFFCNDTATTEIYTYGHTLSLHDALPIYDAQAFVAPLRRLPAGFAQYPAADADDVAGSLGMADEMVGPHLAQLPVLPADQGLGGDDAAALEVDLGLVDQVELVVVGSPAQVRLHAQPVLLRLRQCRGEHLQAVADAALADRKSKRQNSSH